MRTTLLQLLVALTIAAGLIVVSGEPSRRPRRTLDYPLGGVVLPLHSQDASYDYERELTEIAELGAGWVELILSARQAQVDSSQIPSARDRAPSYERLEKTILLAREKGLRVLLLPIVLIEDPGPDDWRGTLRPQQADLWWRSYETWLLQLARVAEACGAQALSVGSEYASLEDEELRWRQLIRAVRREFGGALTYSANWDHFEEIGFWSELDFAGMTAYFELSKAEQPTLEELRSGWQLALTEIERLAALSGLPTVITEVGVPSARGAAGAPWDYTRREEADPALQLRCFESFEATFLPIGGRSPQFGGVFFYDWWGWGGPSDASYTARSKPAAECWGRMLKALQSEG